MTIFSLKETTGINAGCLPSAENHTGCHQVVPEKPLAFVSPDFSGVALTEKSDIYVQPMYNNKYYQLDYVIYDACKKYRKSLNHTIKLVD